MKADLTHPRSTAFLLAQIGAHAAARFAERLGDLQLTPAHAGMLRLIHGNAGISQRSLSSTLKIVPSRLVALIDELEDGGLVERRDSPDDRRAHALHLTRKGTEALEAIGKVARAHDDTICTGLTAEERVTLGALLRRIADQQGLTPGVHPGFSRLGRPPDGAEGSPRGRRRR
jgi:DNA-binding MarR family transcriptional regulator